MVHSLIRRFPNSLCPTCKNPWQDTWVYWSLLNVRDGNYKRGLVRPGGSWKQRERERERERERKRERDCLSLFPVLLTLMLTYGKGRTWRFLITNNGCVGKGTGGP
jgi:hypothetical protein